MPLPWEVKWPGQDQQALQDNAPNFFKGVGDWWDGIMKADQQRVNDTMAQYHARPDYQRNLAELNKNRGLPAGAANTTANASGTPYKPSSGPSQSLRLLQNLNAYGNKTTMDTPVEPQMSPEEEMMEATIKAIQERLQHGYVDDGAYAADIDAAYGGAFDAINNARSKANSNYQESDKVLEGLTAGHVNVIKGEDMDSIKKIGQEHQTELKGIYDQGIQAEQADRQKEIDARAESLARYGLQESGMGTAGQEQTKAVANMQQDSTGAQNMARGFQASNEALNVARGQSAANEGVERRSSLRHDLDNILGDLDQSQASVSQQKAQAMLAAKNADKQAFNESQRTDADTLEKYLEQKREDRKMKMEADSKSKGTGTSFDVASQRFRSAGVDPAPYLDAYSATVADNSYSSVSGKDKVASYVESMMKKNPKLNRSQAMQWVSMIENYGTDKMTAS